MTDDDVQPTPPSGPTRFAGRVGGCAAVTPDVRPVPG